jgi:hypothetical protein
LCCAGARLAPEALHGGVFTDLRAVQFSKTSSLGSPWLKRLQGVPCAQPSESPEDGEE